MLTLFTFGYWGWGNSTEQLLEAADAAEKARGFGAPMFVDIRMRRAVRATGFSGDAFERLVGSTRHRHMKGLGNRSIVTGESRIVIDKPDEAKTLLDLAIEQNKHGRRVIFFCSCEDVNVKTCHRSVVADLVLKEAEGIGRQVAVVEWPGGEPLTKVIEVPAHTLKAARSGRKTIPLTTPVNLKEFAGLPWGSVITLEADGAKLNVLSGPAKYQGGWCLPIVEPSTVGLERSALVKRGQRFRREKGLEPRYAGGRK